MGSLFFPSLRSLSAELPPPEAFQVSRDRIAPGPRITSYLRYQLDRAWRQDEQRMARWAAIRTESDWLAWQRETRTRLLELIGGLPSEKTPLNARITGRVQGEGFHIEKVIFESLPRFPVSALLYLPGTSGGGFQAARWKPAGISVKTTPQAAPLAWAIHTVFLGMAKAMLLEVSPEKWGDWVEHRQEQWPIQFLLPGGAYIMTRSPKE